MSASAREPCFRLLCSGLAWLGFGMIFSRGCAVVAPGPCFRLLWFGLVRFELAFPRVRGEGERGIDGGRGGEIEEQRGSKYSNCFRDLRDRSSSFPGVHIFIETKGCSLCRVQIFCISSITHTAVRGSVGYPKPSQLFGVASAGFRCASFTRGLIAMILVMLPGVPMNMLLYFPLSNCDWFWFALCHSLRPHSFSLAKMQNQDGHWVY